MRQFFPNASAGAGITDGGAGFGAHSDALRDSWTRGCTSQSGRHDSPGGAARGWRLWASKWWWSASFTVRRLAREKILSQAAAAGVKVRRGWSIRVAESLGPQRVAIPNVSGQSERVAELNVRRRGLDLGSVAQLNLADAAVDQVVSQSPAGERKRK